MKYRNIERDKYQLLEDLTIVLPFDFGISGSLMFAKLEGSRLHFYKGFVWDGPSGPTIDTKDSMHGSAAHDVLYEMMKFGIIPMSMRHQADKVLAIINEQYGMPRVRASIWEKAVNLFGGLAIFFGKERKVTEIKDKVSV